MGGHGTVGWTNRGVPSQEVIEQRKEKELKKAQRKQRHEQFLETTKSWIVEKGNRLLVLDHDNLPQMISMIMHGIDHEKGGHEVTHRKSVGHCYHGLHTINDYQANSVPILRISRNNKFYLEKVSLRFEDNCNGQEGWHVESAQIFFEDYPTRERFPTKGTKEWIIAKGHRSNQFKHETLPKLIALLFHHIHHSGQNVYDPGRHKAHHCDGGGQYKIHHCRCGLHAINKKKAVLWSLGVDKGEHNTFNSREIEVQFTNPCKYKKGWMHVESATVVSGKNNYIDRHPSVLEPKEDNPPLEVPK